MIPASGSNPLARRDECTLILRVIHLMNDPGPEALADPTLIMLWEPHLGGVCVCGGGGTAGGGARECDRRAAYLPREQRRHHRQESEGKI